jgi:adenylate cyclase class 2
MSFEIEIKAHVYNRNFVIEKLNSIAEYLGHTEKKDTYYHIPKQSVESSKEKTSEEHITVRIRSQIEKNSISENFFTYKKKELQTSTDGVQFEVNVENETFIENPNAMEQFLFDIGGKIAYTKEKIVEHWTYKTQNEELHVELCTVPPLGDFLEIEVIKETQNQEEIIKIKQLEEQLLQECEIPLTQIEPKYYSQMLDGNSVK